MVKVVEVCSVGFKIIVVSVKQFRWTYYFTFEINDKSLVLENGLEVIAQCGQTQWIILILILKEYFFSFFDWSLINMTQNFMR